MTGLDCGADDYMTKPFAPEDLRLCLDSCTLCCGTKSVHLGFKEFEVLLVVFAAVCYSSYRNLEESKRAMYLALSPQEGGGRQRGERFRQPLPGQEPLEPIPGAAVFSVLLDKSGELAAIDSRFLTVTEELAREAASQALAREPWEGVLPELGLRFLKRQSPEGLRIAFADMTWERSSMLHLMTTSLLVGAGGLTAFFLISLFLARWALRPVERSWDQQRQFVADASHELKTPLTVILANTGILLTHPEEPVKTQLKWIENTREEANRMKGLVNDLLFLAKSDAAQLQQLAVILLDNACKYAGEGGQVKFRLERSGSLGRIRVCNTGTPIPPEQLAHVFDRFYRADPSRTASDGSGGYGLGLAIARSIAEQHRGRIWAESSAAAGTIFTVTLPLAGKGKTGG